MSADILFCFSLWSLCAVFGCVSVIEGDSVTLAVNLTEHQRKHGISWMFGARGYLIAEITRGDGKVRTYEDQADGRFRDRLKLDHTGSLTITKTRITHSGLYEVTNTSTNAKLKIFNITVHGDARRSVPVVSDTSFTFIHTVVMCCAAAVGCVMIVTSLLIFCICRKHKHTTAGSESRDLRGADIL